MGNANNSEKKAVRTIGFMAVIIFVAKIMGLLRETMIAGVYGRGYESDLINTATQIPLLFFDMTLGIAILSTFVPIFNKYLEKESRERAEEFANNFMNTVITVSTLAAIAGIIFAEPIVSIMVPGFDENKVLETARLLRLLFPAIIFTAAAYTSVGILQSLGEFNVPSLISFVSNLIMILYLTVFGDKFGLTGVILSMLLAWAAQLLVQIPSLRKKGFKYRLTFNFRDEGIKEAAILALPVLISSWIQPVCAVINMAFGSSLGDGAVSGLNWANKIYIIMVGVFAYAITNFIFPTLSRMSAGDNEKGFAETTRTSIGFAVYIITYIAAMFIALSVPIIKVVFEHGEFTADDTMLTASALLYYSFGMVAYAICEVLNKSFYAIQDGKTPMYSSIVGIAVNFIAAYLLVGVFKMGVGGLALSGAVSSVSIALVLLVMINKRRGRVITLEFVINMLKTFVCGIAASLTARLIYRFTENIMGGGIIVTFVKLCIAAFPALLVYMTLGFILRVKEIKQILVYLKR